MGSQHSCLPLKKWQEPNMALYTEFLLFRKLDLLDAPVKLSLGLVLYFNKSIK